MLNKKAWFRKIICTPLGSFRSGFFSKSCCHEYCFFYITMEQSLNLSIPQFILKIQLL